ncbi:uncharacterized protein LOC141905766 [Tubulanus polymorphus]|uniref:uncharacterized protein LOC141905766 n=1 Tax=Tubulanus polymorphus TaxID=672921 RepID=UPI003DA29EF6
MNPSSSNRQEIGNQVKNLAVDITDVINDIDKLILGLKGLSSAIDTITDAIEPATNLSRSVSDNMSANYGKQRDGPVDLVGLISCDVVDKPTQRTVEPADIAKDTNSEVWTREVSSSSDPNKLNSSITGAIGLEYLKREGSSYANKSQEKLHFERLAHLVALTKGLRLRDHCEFCHLGDNEDRTYCSIYERYVDSALEGAFDTLEYDSASCDEMEYDLETYEQYEADYDRELNTWTTYSMVHIDTHSIFSDDYELELERLDDVGGLESSFGILTKSNDDLINDNVLKPSSDSVKNTVDNLTFNNLNVMTSSGNTNVTQTMDNNELKIEKNIVNLQTFNDFYENDDKKSYEKILNFSTTEKADLINYNS